MKLPLNLLLIIISLNLFQVFKIQHFSWLDSSQFNNKINAEFTKVSDKTIYKFTHETIAEITSSEDNRTYKMSYLLNPDESYVGMMADMSEYSDEELDGESVIVMDNGKTHIFVETNGMKIRMSPDMMGGQQMQNPTDQMADYDYTHLKKTGNTKTVLGAKCYEYTMSDKDVKMNLWVAPEINLPNWFIQNQKVLKGHILEYTIISKDGNMTSKTIAINDNILKEINPKDYKKMF